MFSINPYLNFNGNTEEAFLFYQSVFGGEFEAFQRFGDMPNGGDLPENERGKIMHVAFPIGNGNILMASDVLTSMGHQEAKGNNIYISIGTDTRAEAERLYNALSEGGTIEMPLQETFWGAYFGMFDDKFGIRWMINCDNK